MIAAGTLYIVATPIGNLADISARAREILAGVTLVAAEDTRHTGRLLAGLGIRRPLLSVHEHNERERIPALLDRLRAGEAVALVTDAGTPLVSDPGFQLVRAAVDAGIDVCAVPGPCAAVAALSVAGLATDRFAFEGFLPTRATARRQRLARLATDPRTLVFYEAPQRVAQALGDMAVAFGAERRAAVARELTKLHEAVYHGTLGNLAARAASDRDMSRGELVCVVQGAADTVPDDTLQLDHVLSVLLKLLSPSQAAAAAAGITGLRRNDCYARALELHRS
jgi:16S rRNA (cytidine1402-2'-O)-methyltransferase